MPRLPSPRGAISERVIDALRRPPGSLDPGPVASCDQPLADDDLHLSLYVLYELHYRGFDGVDPRWEWDVGALELRARLETVFEAGLYAALAGWTPPPADARTMDIALRRLIDEDDGPSLSQHLERRGTREEFSEFLIHRSAYQLNEADPLSWAIPRLDGPPKATLVEVQADEYGGGDPTRIHARLFAETMDALGLIRPTGRIST